MDTHKGNIKNLNLLMIDKIDNMVPTCNLYNSCLLLLVYLDILNNLIHIDRYINRRMVDILSIELLIGIPDNMYYMDDMYLTIKQYTYILQYLPA